MSEWKGKCCPSCGALPCDQTDPQAARTTEDAVERVASWQPIETAPKDGTRIMGASWSECSGWRQFVLFWNDVWGGEPFWQFGGCEEHPTHWMPLPEPPALEGDER